MHLFNTFQPLGPLIEPRFEIKININVLNSILITLTLKYTWQRYRKLTWAISGSIYYAISGSTSESISIFFSQKIERSIFKKFDLFAHSTLAASTSFTQPIRDKFTLQSISLASKFSVAFCLYFQGAEGTPNRKISHYRKKIRQVKKVLSENTPGSATSAQIYRTAATILTINAGTLVMGQNAMAAGGTLAYLPGAREWHGILTLYPGKSDFPTKIRYYRTSNAAINLIPSSFS